MTNFDRADDVIAASVGSTILGSAIATVLADKGLLMPDLPRKDRITGAWYPKASGLGIGNITSNDGIVTLRTGKLKEYSMDFSPSEARQIGLIFLAAANNMENNA